MKSTIISIYRKGTASSWADATRTLVGTFEGRIQPVSMFDAMQNNQQNKSVKELIICDDVTLVLDSFDELEWGGVRRYIYGVETYDQGVLPHLEIYTTDSQGTP